MPYKHLLLLSLFISTPLFSLSQDVENMVIDSTQEIAIEDNVDSIQKSLYDEILESDEPIEETDNRVAPSNDPANLIWFGLIIVVFGAIVFGAAKRRRKN